MLRKAASHVAWVGRTASMVFGLALVMALVLGVGTTALAAVPGDPLKLGRVNAINTLTQMVGSTNDALLRVQNLSSGKDASALELRVEAGKAPMRVSGGAGKAAGLNVDAVDGKSAGAFFSGKTYFVQTAKLGPGGGSPATVLVFCDPGDTMLGGGGEGISSVLVREDVLTSDRPIISQEGKGWQATVVDNGSASNISVSAFCADFPPLRP